MKTPDLKALLGAAIKAERSALGISQEELAYRAGLHRTYVSDLERGARNPSLASVEKLARALELSVPVLFQRAVQQRNEAAGRDSVG
jgi:transcriptional regulator with XRE-family HTH domain